jgi:exonuclease III
VGVKLLWGVCSRHKFLVCQFTGWAIGRGTVTIKMAEETKQPSTLSILSFNIGLLDYYLPGVGVVYKYPDYAEQRMYHVPDAIRRANADIVCLQECYTSFQIHFIVSALSDMYPYHSHKSSPGWWKLQNGMVTLSKHPIVGQYMLPFTQISTLEAWFANKSQLISLLEIPSMGKVAILNIHTTAGGFQLPTHPSSDADREHELAEVHAVVKDVEKDGYHAIIVGDYNCGPNSSSGNWIHFRKFYNYRDLFVEAYEGNRWTSENGQPYTWDPLNYLNKIGPHKELPPDRLDHMSISGGDKFWENYVCSDARILFMDTCVDIPCEDGGKSTISDHYGLYCELSVSCK